MKKTLDSFVEIEIKQAIELVKGINFSAKHRYKDPITKEYKEKTLFLRTGHNHFVSPSGFKLAI